MFLKFNINGSANNIDKQNKFYSWTVIYKTVSKEVSIKKQSHCKSNLYSAIRVPGGARTHDTEIGVSRSTI